MATVWWTGRWTPEAGDRLQALSVAARRPRPGARLCLKDQSQRYRGELYIESIHRPRRITRCGWALPQPRSTGKPLPRASLIFSRLFNPGALV